VEQPLMMEETMKLILFCTALLYGLLVQAQGVHLAQAQAEVIYKWRDAAGKLQYTEVPPPTGFEFELLNKPAPPKNNPEKAMENLREQVEAADKAREEAKQQEQTVQETQGRAELFAKNCETARNNVKALEGSQPVVRTDAEGRRIVLDTEQRNAALAQARKDMTYYCNP
jgi:hypothetical protein